MSGCSGSPSYDAVELALEPVEQREAIAVDLVAELIDEPREPVDREQVVARLTSEQARGDGEVLVRREGQDGVLAREEPFRRQSVPGGEAHPTARLTRCVCSERCVNASPADPVRRFIRPILVHHNSGIKRHPAWLQLVPSMAARPPPRRRHEAGVALLGFDAAADLSYTTCVLRRLLLPPAALALAVGLVACGGVARTLDPVAEAAGKSSGAGSVRVSIDASFSANAVSATLQAHGAFDADKGELTVDLSDLGGELNLPGAAGGLGEVKLITTKEDGHSVVYVNLPSLASVVPGGKAWIKADVEEAASAAGGSLGDLLGLSGQSPAELLDLLRDAGGVENAGPDSIDGTAVTHYRAWVDLVRALEKQGVPSEAVQALVASGAPTQLPVDVWIGAADGYVHRVAASYEATLNGETVSAKLTVTLSDWGTDVSVDVPPDDEVFDVTALAGTLGKSFRKS